jgi:hypothetical protein
MFKTMTLISTFVFMGFLCNAQVDTLKKTSDTLKANSTRDSIPGKVQLDTDNYALLYVYRPKNYVGSIISYDLKLNNSLLTGSVIGRVKNNSKFVVKLYQEGKTEIFAQTESKKSVTIDVKYGQKYYLKCGIAMGAFVGRPELNLIYPEQGVLDYENIEGREN